MQFWLRCSTWPAIIRHKKINPNKIKLKDSSLDVVIWNVVDVVPMLVDALVRMNVQWARKCIVSLSSTNMAPELVF